jgi:hypothetical protein
MARSTAAGCGEGRGNDAERGQASVELVAVIPVLILGLLVAVQMALAGWALWTAGVAARAGARAAHVGGDPEAAASSAVPAPLRSEAEVDVGGRVEVRVSAPSLVPGVPRIPVTAAARLAPGGGGV